MWIWLESTCVVCDFKLALNHTIFFTPSMRILDFSFTFTRIIHLFSRLRSFFLIFSKDYIKMHRTNIICVSWSSTNTSLFKCCHLFCVCIWVYVCVYCPAPQLSTTNNKPSHIAAAAASQRQRVCMNKLTVSLILLLLLTRARAIYKIVHISRSQISNDNNTNIYLLSCIHFVYIRRRRDDCK